MWNIIRLELWKQRKAFFSILLVLTLGAGFPAFILPLFRPASFNDSFSGAAVVILLLLPLAIAFLGASAASSLRRPDEKIHEELLAIDPLIRIYGAFIVSFAFNACVSVLVLSLFGFPQVFELISIRFGFFQIPVEVLLGYSLSLHCLSFAMSYLFNLPVLAAGLALGLSFIDFFFRGVLYLGKHGVLMYWFGDRFPEPLHFAFFLPLLLIVLTPLFMVRRIERRQNLGFVRVLVLCGCFLFAPLWSLIMSMTVARAFDAENQGFSFWNAFWEMLAASLS